MHVFNIFIINLKKTPQNQETYDKFTIFYVHVYHYFLILKSSENYEIMINFTCFVHTLH